MIGGWPVFKVVAPSTGRSRLAVRDQTRGSLMTLTTLMTPPAVQDSSFFESRQVSGSCWGTPGGNRDGKTKRNGRSGSVLAALAAVAGLIFAGCEGGPTTPSDPAQTQAGLDWRLLQEGGGFTSPHGLTGQSLSDVASDGERFVGVGGDGTIMLSADGNQWTAASDSGTSAFLYRVAWGGGRFVALGNKGTAENHHGHV